MRRRPYFLSAPQDVLALQAQAEDMLDRLMPCSPERLVLAAGRERHDLALMLLYRACYRGPNGDFLRQVAGLPAGPAPLQSAVRIMIVPGLNFRAHPEMGADGRLVNDIAARLGAKAEIIDINPRGAVSANAAIIAERLRRLSNEPVWLVSISKGTADLRAAFGLLGGWPKGVSGWVNLSGVFQGTPIADQSPARHGAAGSTARCSQSAAFTSTMLGKCALIRRSGSCLCSRLLLSGWCMC